MIYICLVSALAIFTTIYGVVGALSGLFQLQRMYLTASAQDISLRFFLVYFGGYWVWLFYGIVEKDPALIVVDTVGIFVGVATISFAIYLRVAEGGQKIIDAVLDRPVTVRGAWSLSSNSAQEDLGPRPPGVMEQVIYSPIYPLKRIDRVKQDPGVEGIKKLGDESENLHFFRPTANWREIDGGSKDWKSWRENLHYAISYLEEEGVEPKAAPAAYLELNRKNNARPSPERLSFCRTIFILSLVVERKKRWPKDLALPAIQEQVDHPRGFLKSEQRWLEQLLATFYLPVNTFKSPSYLKKVQKKLPANLNASEKAFVASGSWQDLLWPVQAGVNDFWGSPKALNSPIIKESWLEEENELAILSSLLHSARQRNPAFRRYFFIHPIDYSINNGWQGLVLEKVYDESLYSYFPLETSFLKAIGRTIGQEEEELIQTVYNLDLGYAALELARMSGVGLDVLINVYENNYKKIAKRCLPFQNDLDFRRSEESWLRLLK